MMARTDVPARIDRDGNNLIVYVPFIYKHLCQETLGGEWDRSRRAWIYPRTQGVVLSLAQTFGWGALSEDAQHFVQRFGEPGPAMQHTLKTTPWTHQLQAYEFAYHRQGTLLAMDMGTGKTLVAIALMNAWIAAGDMPSVALVVCPKSVVAVWESELQKHSSTDWHVAAKSDKGVTQRIAYMRRLLAIGARTGRPVLLVANYAAVIRPQFCELVKDIGQLGVLVLDEGHRIKAAAGKQSKQISKYARVADRILGLTGTPMPHSPLDLFAQYRAIEPAVYGLSYFKFKTRYAVMGGYAGKQVLGFTNQDELSRKMATTSFMVKKRDVLDLPPVLVSDRHFVLSAAERKVYKELEIALYTFLEKGKEVTIENVLTKLLRLQQVTSGYVMADRENMDGTKLDDWQRVVKLGKSKLDALAEYLQDLPLDEPLVIFCRFRYDIKQIEEYFAATREKHTDQARSCCCLYGGRNELKEWQDGLHDVLLVQIQAGGEGIDLTRAAYAVYFSLSYSLGMYEQSLARLDRPGQTRPVTYTRLIARGTIDGKIMAALAKRRAVVTAIIDSAKDKKEHAQN